MAESLDNRYNGKYKAYVVDIDDPQQRGRMRVRCPAVTGKATSAWANVSIPVAENGGGDFCMPKVGETVWVEFENGNANQPIVVGSWYANGTAPLEDYEAESKNTRVVNHDNATTKMSTASDGTTSYDTTADSIYLCAATSTFGAIAKTNMTLTALEDFRTEAGKISRIFSEDSNNILSNQADVSIAGYTDMTLLAKTGTYSATGAVMVHKSLSSMTNTASSSISSTSGGAYTVNAGSTLKTTSKSSTSISAKSSISLSGSTTATLSGGSSATVGAGTGGTMTVSAKTFAFMAAATVDDGEGGEVTINQGLQLAVDDSSIKWHTATPVDYTETIDATGVTTKVTSGFIKLDGNGQASLTVNGDSGQIVLSLPSGQTSIKLSSSGIELIKSSTTVKVDDSKCSITAGGQTIDFDSANIIKIKALL